MSSMAFKRVHTQFVINCHCTQNATFQSSENVKILPAKDVSLGSLMTFFHLKKRLLEVIDCWLKFIANKILALFLAYTNIWVPENECTGVG